MSDRCLNCGAILALVGIAHRCVPRPAKSLAEVWLIPPEVAEPGKPAAPPKPPKPRKARKDKPPKPPKPPRPPKPPKPPKPKRPRGRPKSTAKPPWEEAGVSRRTWFRQKAKNGKDKS